MQKYNTKIAIGTSAIGIIFLAIAYVSGFLLVGIIFFPVLWGIIYKFIQKIKFANRKHP
ncbi:hypothetical protein [Paenibacillus sp. GXUN7292]|uniref:hypothetical protein n=1 Tax=Paenibacillus sp. GXUN7292 TaxID=3422499 RepID=UPI003D7E0EA1